MIELEELTTIKALIQISGLEKNIWGMSLPVHQTLTASKNGGIVIGAFYEKKFIGFSYAFTGFKEGKTYLCSHMLGIDEAYRSKKIGEQLKRKQREIAIDKGYTEIRWTFDPLETRNGYLNLSKLNGICSTYLENAYGDMKDGLNQGIPSDRFEIHWHLSSKHVTDNLKVNYEDAVLLNEVSINNDIPIFESYNDDAFTADVYALDVPRNFQHIKTADHHTALDWRYKTRKIFQDLFAAGYAAVYLIPNEQLAAYIFVKKETLKLGGDT